jgi:hypothetical protein
LGLHFCFFFAMEVCLQTSLKEVKYNITSTLLQKNFVLAFFALYS